MTNMLKDKVVLVTGAGGGIGREMALLAAREGAKVVVNDLGGAVDGEGGGSTTPAQKVCDEIAAFGGKAVPNGDSVTDPAGAERMVKAAVENFGRIDGVINNAGILRDRIFHRMSHMDWKMVIDVHLNGAFNVSRAAANYFKEQKSGAFVHFTSTSGLVGNFGQANYSAAKMGIIGLSRSIALDMAAFNVRSNCISPFAWTRMIGTIPADTAGAGGAPGALQEDDPGQDRADGGVPAVGCRPCRRRQLADLRRAHERDHAVQRQPSGTLGAHVRGLDAGGDRRDRRAGDEALLHRPQALARILHLGSDLMAVDKTKNEPRIDADEVLGGIVEWVSIESPSHDAKSVNKVVDHVEGQFRDLGLKLERTPGVDGFGDILECKTQPGWNEGAMARASWCWPISIPCIPSA